jgi:cardiolipin synthase A/B
MSFFRHGSGSTARQWQHGNKFELLENGEEYFPAVYEAIAAAKKAVLIETFILFEDSVGKRLHSVLTNAAKRGVSVDITVDGYGSSNLSPQFISQLTQAGARLHIFDPRRPLLGIRTNIFRRMHRKIVAIDGVTAFIGGINYGEDHLMSFGEMAKQDYAVRIDGPLANEIQAYTQNQIAAFHAFQWPTWRSRTGSEAPRGSQGQALFVYRDNDNHRDDIERHYRAAIRSAKHEVIIANAYFFPGYRLLRQLRRAARRGVSVKLILQGAPDVPQAKTWATMLYPSLLNAGVQIYEYCRRPLHAKVALVDDVWATVGSSNLDPLSLSLNLEANVIIRDEQFNRDLRRNLEALLLEHCQQVQAEQLQKRSLWLLMSNFVGYHGTRHFPRLAGWLPAHLPRLHSPHADEAQRVTRPHAPSAEAHGKY